MAESAPRSIQLQEAEAFRCVWDGRHQMTGHFPCLAACYLNSSVFVVCPWLGNQVPPVDTLHQRSRAAEHTINGRVHSRRLAITPNWFTDIGNHTRQQCRWHWTLPQCGNSRTVYYLPRLSTTKMGSVRPFQSADSCLERAGSPQAATLPQEVLDKVSPVLTQRR